MANSNTDYPQEKTEVLSDADANMARLEAIDAKLKRQVRIVKGIQRFISFVLSAIVLGITSMTLAKYLSTKNKKIDGVSPWPPRTVLWPTLLLLSVSASAFLLYSSIMISYCFSVRSANIASSVTSFFTIIFGFIRFSAWLVAAVLDKVGNRTGRGLWGWSCGGSDNLPPDFQAVVNFATICSTNGHTYHISYASAGIEALGIIIWISFMLRRLKSKHALKKARRHVSVNV